MLSSRSIYPRLRAHTESKWSIMVAFVWGFCEGTAFFVVPDVYLGFVALLNWRRGMRAMLAVVAGAMAGGALIYNIASNDPGAVNLFLARIPLVSADMVAGTGARMQAEGLISMINGPLRGIPYKVYAAQAGEQGLPFAYFMLLTIPARLGRLLPVVLMVGGVGKALRSLVETQTPLIIGAYVIVWGAIYVLYYLTIR